MPSRYGKRERESEMETKDSKKNIHKNQVKRIEKICFEHEDHKTFMFIQYNDKMHIEQN